MHLVPAGAIPPRELLPKGPMNCLHIPVCKQTRMCIYLHPFMTRIAPPLSPVPPHVPPCPALHAQVPALSVEVYLRGRGYTRRQSHPAALQVVALHCTALHCTALHATARHCNARVLYCMAPHCTKLHCIALYCTAPHCTGPFPWGLPGRVPQQAGTRWGLSSNY